MERNNQLHVHVHSNCTSDRMKRHATFYRDPGWTSSYTFAWPPVLSTGLAAAGYDDAETQQIPYGSMLRRCAVN